MADEKIRLQCLGLPVDDAFGMQIFQPCNDLGRVEASSVLVEATRGLDMEHEVTSVKVFHHKEQVALQGGNMGGQTHGSYWGLET